jgi:PrtD family type I secretion system ABC transporter
MAATKRSQGQTPGKLRSVLSGLRREFAVTGLFSFCINLLMLVSPLFMLQVYDRVLTSRSGMTLLMLAILAIGLLVIMGFLDGLRARLLVRTGKRIDNLTNDALFYGVFKAAVFKPGLSGGQYFRDLDSVRQFLTGGPVLAFFDAPWAPVYLLIITLMHPLLGAIATMGAVIIFGLGWLNEAMTRATLKTASEESFLANDIVDRSLRNAEVLRAMGMGEGIRRLWRSHQNAALEAQCRASDRAGGITAASRAVRMVLQVCTLAAGAYLAIDQIITPGVMIAASIIMGRALAPFEQAIGGWRGFVQARSAYGRLNVILNASDADQPGMSLPAPKGRVSLDRVLAAPPGVQTPVLKGISFALEPGECLGIVGPSAAGKTTLARIILGIWPARAGEVRLDGADVFAWNHDELGAHVGYLPQDVELFSGTVADNIARFTEVDSEAVVAAAKAAGIHDMILSLANGYDTQIGISGVNLSAGQRQRVGLARALYKDPALVVLDEPNANLDTDGEAALGVAVQGLKARGATVIIISHRRGILGLVDKVMILSGGQVAAFGPRDEVLNRLDQAGRSPIQQPGPRVAVAPAE